MIETNILAFSPGWDGNARKLARFTDIPATCAEVLARLPAHPVGALDEALAADSAARRAARDFLGMRDGGQSLHGT